MLGGLFLLSVAFGYQLDKFELVYSTRGVATGVSYTDQHAQFFAFDVLTVVSALAAAFLVGGAFTRCIWPLGLTARRSGSSPRSSSAGSTRRPSSGFTVEPNQFAQEQPYIANNIAMTRLAFGLQAGRTSRSRATQPLTPGAGRFRGRTRSRTPGCGTTGRSATRSTSSRPSAATTTSPTSTPTATRSADEQRQVMLSGRELALEQNPNATGWVNQRIVYTHGIGVAMVPVNEVTNEGQPHLFIGNLPPVSVDGAPPITEPRIYFGERPSDYVVVGAQQDEFDYPTGDGRRVRARTGPRRAGPARPASSSTRRSCGCCSRSASATSTC